MSKVVKEMIIDEYKKRFDGVNDAVIVDIRYLDANQNSTLRTALDAKDIHVTVVRNSLARKAFDGTPLASLNPILSGPNAVIYGAETVVDVAREIVDWAKKFKKIELKGAILDGDMYEGKAGVEALSKFPTRTEAQAQVVQIVLSPAGNLLGAVTSPGSELVSILKTIEEKLEKGESIAKVS